ncbi:MAG TPA: UDP-N-acetylmuramate dehydrogenase [Alphaproteobacteria bacterium]|nr:UDP-N-acetylmuramate dehydrogenase [Alphaproteobacteria bacterium]
MLAERISKTTGLRADDFPDEGLLERLPRVRGKLTPNEPLAPYTWFRVGGPAEALFKPVDEEDLAHFLGNCPADIPITVIGLASNLLVRDGGVPGVVIKLGPQFATIKVAGALITAGAGAVDLNVARTAQASGIAGMEFLCGIPGTIGGGLRMNAGAYKREFTNIVKEAKVIDRDGKIRTLYHDQLGFSYRHSDVPADTIFLSAVLQGEEGVPDDIQDRMNEIQKSRAATQPIREKTGGSTFANPENDPEKRKSWQLIEAAGCRGLKIGNAKVSEKHCNFLINTGHSNAAEIENLGEEVRKRVKAKFDVELRWEIKRIGITKEERGV